MPSKSAAQHRLMEAVAHGDPRFANDKIPVKVAREFVRADKKSGGVKKLPEHKK